MKLTALSIQDALDQAKTMPFAYIRSLSGVYVGMTPGTISLAEVMEARFFGETAEIRFLKEAAQMTALEVADGDGDITLDQRTALVQPVGSFLTKRRYILPDEDGQCSIVATRLLTLEGV